MNMNNLFVQETTANTMVQGGANQIEFTAALTQQATMIANDIIAKIQADADNSDMQEMVAESQQSNDAMDNLINELSPLDKADVEWLQGADDNVYDRMLKSQQSKRSRAKNKAMTLENYRVMLIAAVAEGYIRLCSGKDKIVGRTSTAGSLELTEDLIQMYTNDQELLKKAIRNVQSRKSIMKAKADFDENSEAWNALLDYEAQLKTLRVGSVRTIDPKVEQAAAAAEQTRELLETVNDIDSLKAADAKELLKKIQEVLATM